MLDVFVFNPLYVGLSMDLSKKFDKEYAGWSILYSEGSQIIISKVL